MNEKKPPPSILCISHKQVTHMTNLFEIVTDPNSETPQGKKSEMGWIINTGVRFSRDGSQSTDDFNNMVHNAEASGYQHIFITINN